MTPARIEVANGGKKAVFRRTEAGWVPDWFCLGDRPMLRFKDHEWLSIGHEHPAVATEARRVRGGGAIFRGEAQYGGVPVAWRVRVEPDPMGAGFIVECILKPRDSVELLEAYSTFETPYEYDGREHVTTVIGQNPVARWAGAERMTPPIWKHPAWVYSRGQAVRMTGPCHTPFLCHAIVGPEGAGRHTTVIGDWNVCKVRDVYVTPTRTVASESGDEGEARPVELRGYKFIVGALNWSSAFAKDPNVLFKGGVGHRQRVIVDFDSAPPGGSLDAMLLAAWERAAALDLPADGRVAAYDRATARGVSWAAATGWLRGVFCGEGAEGLFKPAEGIQTYATGTRPKIGGYSWCWWPQWAGGFHYRALLLGDAPLAATADRYDQVFAEKTRGEYGSFVAMSVATLPSLWWCSGPGRGSVLAEALRGPLCRALEGSVAENGKSRRQMDFGTQAVNAEAFLLTASVYGDTAFQDQALLLLGEANAQLDGRSESRPQAAGRFWEFGLMDNGRSEIHGGQIRPLGHGHAVLANLLAWRATGRAEHLAAARRFARLLLAIHYVTHNGSADPDFDWRGWANGTNAGRDQYAEFPPWETSNSLLCAAGLMAEQDLEPGFYDVLWYFARTGLAQFPAARTLKRILDPSMRVHYLRRAALASERAYYDSLPYLAYENPHDQTLLAPYQGTDCLLGELVFGGGLAKADDDRLGVLVPRAALLDPGEQTQRVVHLWNPTRAAIEATVTVTWPDGRTAQQRALARPRIVAELSFSMSG